MSRRITLGIVLALVLCGLVAAIGLLPDTSKTTVVTFPPGSGVENLAWNPNSTKILAVVRLGTSASGDKNSLRLLTVDLSGEITFLSDETSETSYLGLSWSPSGELAVASRQLGDVGRLLAEGVGPEMMWRTELFLVSADGEHVGQLAEAQVGRAYIMPQWSPDGTRVAAIVTTQGMQGIWVAPVAEAIGGKATRGRTYASPDQSVVGAPMLMSFVWSCDGQFLVVVTQDLPALPEAELMWRLYRLELSSGEWHELRSFGENMLAKDELRWSRDGQRITAGQYERTETGGDLRFWAVDVDSGAAYATTDLRPPPDYSTFFSPFSWSPDMSRAAVVAIRYEPLHKRLYIFRAADGALVARPLSAKNLYGVAWSPDGHWITCVRNENEIVILDASSY